MAPTTVVDAMVLSDIPPPTRSGMVHSSRCLLAAAEEACMLAERLQTLTQQDGELAADEESLLATKQIARTIALLNEAHGALLFG